MNEERKYCVYKHTSPNNKVYIGLTSMEPKHRWNNGKGYSGNVHFTNAINKYGWDNIDSKILEKGLSKKEACELEIDLISAYGSFNERNGYNKTLGGNTISDEMIKKMVLSRIDNGVYKMNWKKANEVRKIYAETNKTAKEISERFEVSEQAVQNIINNKTWVDKSYVNDTLKKSQVLSERQVKEIRKRYNNSLISCKTLAEEYNVSASYLNAIVDNKERPNKNYKRTRQFQEGEANTKLIMLEVEEIRTLYNTTELSQKDLMEIYSVSKSTMMSLINNKIYHDENYKRVKVMQPKVSERQMMGK